MQHSLARIIFPEKLRRKFFALEDRLFDLRHNIRTGGIIAPGDLEITDFSDAKPHASAFQSVWCRNLRVLIRAARQANQLATFVDVGAGKGKACFYASPHFAEVIGIELSQELVDAARENLRRSGQRNVEFLCADAARYDLPEAPTLVFLFNPFDSVLFEKFLARNLARIRSHGSLIAYANDMERSVLENLGFECLFRDAYRSISLWH